MTLEELMALMKTNYGEMETCMANMTTVRGKTDLSDEDKGKQVTVLEDQFTLLQGKNDRFKTDLGHHEALADLKKTQEAAGKAAALVPTKVQNTDGGAEGELGGADETEAQIHGKLMAVARNEYREERAKSLMFCDWMACRKVPEKFQQEMMPKSQGFAGKAQVGSAMLMPSSMAAKILSMAYSGKSDGLLLSTGAGSHGEEFLFDREFRPRLLELPVEPGVVYPRVTRVPTNTGEVLWPKVTQTDGDEHGTVVVTWSAEGAEKGKTEPLFEQVSIKTNELTAQTQISRTLLNRSAIDMEALIPRFFNNAIMHELDLVTLNGSGSGRPLGVLQDASVRQVFRKVLLKIDYLDLVKMKYRIRSHHRGNAVWVVADDAVEHLIGLLDLDGRPFFVPNPLAGQMDRLLGIPMLTTHRTSLGLNGDVILGDWSQYISPVEQEILVQRSEHRFIEKGVVVFIVSVLVGGKPVQGRAFVRLVAEIS